MNPIEDFAKNIIQGQSPEQALENTLQNLDILSSPAVHTTVPNSIQPDGNSDALMVQGSSGKSTNIFDKLNSIFEEEAQQ